MHKKSLLPIAIALASQATITVADQQIDAQSVYSTRTFYGESAENAASEIGKLTEGELSLNVYDPGELVPPMEMLNSVSTGSIPAGWASLPMFSDTIPMASAYGMLPFSPSAEIIFSWTFFGEGRDLIQSELDQYGVKIVPCAYVPQEAGGWFNKKIETIDDFEGLSIRIAGVGSRVYEKLGASPQLLPSNEVYLGLERGRVDAVEFSVPQVDHAMGLSEVADYYYFPGWHSGPTWLAYFINQSSWDSLSEQNQGAIEAACMANIQNDINALPPMQDTALTEIENEGVEILRFSDEVLNDVHDVWLEVVEEEKQRNPGFATAYESLMEHANKYERWDELQAMPKILNK